MSQKEGNAVQMQSEIILKYAELMVDICHGFHFSLLHQHVQVIFEPIVLSSKYPIIQRFID